VTGRDEQVLGLGPTPGNSEHRVADSDSGGLRAESLDDPGELQPGDIGRDPGRGRIPPRPLEQVGPVEPGAVDPNEHLVPLRGGVRAVEYLEVTLDDRDSPHAGGGYRQDVAPGLTFVDEEGAEVVLDASEANALFALTGALEGATVSACPACRSRVVAAVLFVDVLDDSCLVDRSRELIEFADDAPTMHLYIVDDASECEHESWLDPLFDEWIDVVASAGPHALK